MYLHNHDMPNFAGRSGRSVLSTEEGPMGKERINQMK